MTAPSSYDHLREAVAAAARELAAERLFISTGGNVSLREGDVVALTATGTVLSRITPAEVTVIDLDGHIVAGELAPTSETPLHLGCYRAAPPEQVSAVVHTHSRMATTLAVVLTDELPVTHYMQLGLGGPLRIAPFHPFGSVELARAVGEALDGRLAALMANHGSIALGHDLAAAVENAVLVEWLCELHWRAAVIGGPRLLTAEQQQSVLEVARRTGYGTPHRATP